MRISDWSSDVCSSDLVEYLGRQHLGPPILVGAAEQRADSAGLVNGAAASGVDGGRVVHAVSPLMVWKQRDRSIGLAHASQTAQIGRASGRERVCQYV